MREASVRRQAEQVGLWETPRKKPGKVQFHGPGGGGGWGGGLTPSGAALRDESAAIPKCWHTPLGQALPQAWYLQTCTPCHLGTCVGV